MVDTRNTVRVIGINDVYSYTHFNIVQEREKAGRDN